MDNAISFPEYSTYQIVTIYSDYSDYSCDYPMFEQPEPAVDEYIDMIPLFLHMAAVIICFNNIKM